jgi:hypothetical protein
MYKCESVFIEGITCDKECSLQRDIERVICVWIMWITSVDMWISRV